jgi:hypothetical protein
VTGKVVEVTDTHVLVQTSKRDAVRFAKADLSREVRTGQRIELEFKANERKQASEQTKQTTEQTRQREVTQQNTQKRGLDGL